MKPTFYLSKKWWELHQTLKPLLLVGLMLASTSLIYGQEHFYYYNGQKKPLKLNTEYVYLSTSAAISDSTSLKTLINKGVVIKKFSADNAAKSVKAVAQSANQGLSYWAEVKLADKLSSERYADYLTELEEYNSVQNASPYFVDKNGDRIGLSEYLYVKLKNKGDIERLDKMASELGAEIVGQNQFMPLWYTLKTSPKSKLNSLEIANKLYESRHFEHAEPDLMFEDLTNDPNDPLFVDQWGLENTSQNGGTVGLDINALDAWEITKGSRDVTVAVLDHGFEMNHPDLEVNTFGTGFDTGSNSSPAQVLGNHGTACAGIIGAVQDNNRGVSGVAPNSQLMSISNALVLSPTVTQELANGISWAWQNGADVISNSWGHNSLASALIDNAITNALNNGRGGLGTIVVFSAGNDNANVIYPANSNPDIIAVGAADDCGLRVDPTTGTSCLSWNSFQGSCFGNTLDVMGPGALISTTDRQGAPGYTGTDYTGTFGGTSSACPMVAGVAALILSVNPCLTHDEVEDIIEQTAQKVGGYAYAVTGGRPNGTWHNEMGYGMVDAEAAVQMAQQMLPNNISYDIYSKDRPFDSGVEPNPDTGPMWISEDIWVRQDLDGGLSHENPEYKMFSPNGVYVKVTNRGSTMSECANLSLYFTKASTGLVWPTHWNDYTISGVLNGDKINTVSIPPIAPGNSEIIEIPWYPPNPADFTNDIHHFCLLARIESPSDPMFNEQNGVGVGINVKNNNNIAWKNIQVYDNDISNFTSLYVRGVEREWSEIDLLFHDRGFNDKIRKPFFDRGGEIYVKVQPELFERLQKADLKGIKITDKNMLYIASPNAGIYGLPVHSKETFSMHFAFDVEVDPREGGVLLDVLQIGPKKRLQGGERFIITRSGEGKPLKDQKLVADKTDLVYPNPAENEIYIKYDVKASDATVQVSIQNILDANDSMELYHGKHNKGEYVEAYDISKLKKGIYILTLKIGDEVKKERIVIE